ncbi:MAG TPA: hypothetical protein VGO47_07685, partial [Chlamydiales bacterium]|nr:hypothetical protein [Chlamydiales bacterium]
ERNSKLCPSAAERNLDVKCGASILECHGGIVAHTSLACVDWIASKDTIFQKSAPAKIESQVSRNDKHVQHHSITSNEKKCSSSESAAL